MLLCIPATTTVEMAFSPTIKPFGSSWSLQSLSFGYITDDGIATSACPNVHPSTIAATPAAANKFICKRARVFPSLFSCVHMICVYLYIICVANNGVGNVTPVGATCGRSPDCATFAVTASRDPTEMANNDVGNALDRSETARMQWVPYRCIVCAL